MLTKATFGEQNVEKLLGVPMQFFQYFFIGSYGGESLLCFPTVAQHLKKCKAFVCFHLDTKTIS